MPSYAGKFQYLDEHGTAISQGPCQFRFDAQTAVLTPSSGTPLAFDLADADRLVPGEWDLALTLFTGRRLELRQFGAAFGPMSNELLQAWRDRTVRCLLLEDLEELGRFSALAGLNRAPAPAEIRVYKSNLAVLPLDGDAFQWRLAELDDIAFDNSTYTVGLRSGGQRLDIAKLAKKTDEFRGTVEAALAGLRTHAAESLHAVFPFLSPDQLQSLVAGMPEGRSVALEKLRAIHAKLPDAVISQAVDESLRPYFDGLKARSGGSGLMTGFKFLRPDEAGAEDAGGEAGESVGSDGPANQAAKDFFFWFFFPLTNGRVAWEATTGTGRATYLFDAAPPLEESVAQLTRGLALLNFRREPIYVPDDSLEQQERFHRYAIGLRKLPELRKLRAAFRGRAIHTSLEAWTAQLENAAHAS